MKMIAAIAVAAVTLLPQAAPAQVVDELTRRQAFEHYRSGQELLAGERFDLAEQEFSAAIKLDPLMTLAHYGLGQTFMAQRRYASAVLAFTGCREAYAQISALQQRNAVEGERLRMEEITELRDSISRVRAGSIKSSGGQSGALLQRLEARLEDLERTRNTNSGSLPVPAEVSLALGSALFRSSRLPEAEQAWRAAVTVNPRMGEAHNNLAALYLITGRRTEAEAAVRDAERSGLRVNPQMKADISKLPR